MKNNTSFKMMFQNISYNGSYYDNLKIGKPEEFDLDLVMVFPKICNVQMIESDCAGYVYLQLLELEKLMKQQEGFQYKYVFFSIRMRNSFCFLKCRFLYRV